MNIDQPEPCDVRPSPVIRHQAYSVDTARRVTALLGLSECEWSSGDAVPFGWHFPFLSAEASGTRLRADGFPGLGIAMPALPGSRLVAAGRTVEAPGIVHIDQAIERTSRVKSITPKTTVPNTTGRGAITIIVVHHLLCDRQTQERLIEEEQTFILLDTPYTPAPPNSAPSPESIVRTVTPDDTQLFQFSALSFNSHKIHLDRDYARGVEHYPDLVINGGLATLFMTEIARADAGQRIKRLKVRLWFEIRGAPLTTRTTAEWLRIFRDADIAAMPCHTIETLQDDPHLQAVGLFGREEHPIERETITLRSTIIVDGKVATTAGVPQPKGWESTEVATDLGFTPEQIDALFANNTLISNRS